MGTKPEFNGNLSTLFASLRQIRSYLLQEPFPGSMPDPLGRYEGDLIEEYEQGTGDKLGAHSITRGDTFFHDLSAEQRFAWALSRFLPSQWRLAADGSLLRSSLLRLYFRRHLKDPANLPDGSPAKLRIVLAERYKEISGILSFSVNFQESHIVSKEVDDSWNEFLDEPDASPDVATPAQEELEFKKRMLKTLGAIQAAIEMPATPSELLLVFDILSNILLDKHRQRLGFKILGMIEFRLTGPMVMKRRLGDLVGVADGAFGDPLFNSFVDVLEKAEGADLGRVRRLWKVVSYRLLNDVRRAFVQKALGMITDGKGDKCDQVIEILEDKSESEWMDISSDLRAYMEAYKLRKRNGGGGGESGPSMPPGSAPETPPAPVNGAANAAHVRVSSLMDGGEAPAAFFPSQVRPQFMNGMRTYFMITPSTFTLRPNYNGNLLSCAGI